METKAKKINKGEAIKQAEKSINIIDNKKHFVIIYDTFYLNKDLSADEYALFTYLLTRSPNYKPSKHSLMYNLKISERRLLKASKGLQNKGYLFIDNKGQAGKQWTITQTPIIENDWHALSKEQVLQFYNPQNTLDLLERGTISQEQAKERIKAYISAVKSKLDFNADDLQEIINAQWIDD